MIKPSSISNQENSEKKHFDKMADLYDSNYTYNTPFTQYKIQKKMSALFDSHNSNGKIAILEIGAGTGEYTQHLAKLFSNASITAVDISPKVLAVAKKKCENFSNVQFKAMSAYDLPFKNGSFDIVCGFYILHHLDIPATVKEMHRILKQGGEGLFYEPNLLNPVVLAIKSIPYLKEKAGDSPDEWAINPLKFQSYLSKFKSLKWKTSEFVSLPSFIPLRFSIIFDELFTMLGSLPILNLFGGSVSLKFKKA